MTTNATITFLVELEKTGKDGSTYVTPLGEEILRLVERHLLKTAKNELASDDILLAKAKDVVDALYRSGDLVAVGGACYLRLTDLVYLVLKGV